MLGVTHVQINVTLRYDDGHIVTLASPCVNKDIRSGDIFTDKEIVEVVDTAAINMHELVDTKTAKGLYMEAISANRPTYWKQPDKDEPFSPN